MTSQNAAGLDLHVPDKAIATLQICGVDAHLHDRDDACVKAIAAPVVAAELRRLAAEWSPVDEYGARKLRRRADELDPPAVRQET